MWFRSRFTIPAVAAVSFCLIGGTTPVLADIINVPGDFRTIQEAIDAAVDGDEVIVAPGTYFEAINFLGKAITLRSSDGADVTTIDSTGHFHVVQCVSGEGSDTVLDGFVITGGNADGDEFPDNVGGGMFNDVSSPTVTDCIFSENAASINGGGMYNTGSDLTVTDCTFQGNTAEGTKNNTGGGGVFNDGGTVTVTGCTFDGNTATQSGGAMLNTYANTTVTDCVFTANTALGNSSDGGGAIWTFVNPETEVLLVNCDFSENQGFLGGAVCFAAFESDVDPVTLINCSFTNNTATVVGSDIGGLGGAVYIFDVGAILIDCVLVANEALQTGKISWGGGIINGAGGSSMLINCTMSGNTASLGGAIHIWGALSSFSLLNSTLSENTALESGGGIWTEGSSGAITNSILWANSDAGGSDESAQIHLADGVVAVKFSCVQGLTRDLGGSGNIDADPMFVDPGSGNYHLSSGSPCIDAGNNWGVPIDVNDYDEDSTTCELFPADLDGNPRFNADEADFDPGCGVPVVVDMGAYEYQFDPADQVTFADLNGDDVVSAGDILGLLASWGPCGKGCCLADLDLDGTVGASDVLALLASWGPCP